MIDLLKIPKSCSLNLTVSPEKYFGKLQSDTIKGLTWCASFKPSSYGVLPAHEKGKRYDELEIFHVVISNPSKLYTLCQPIYKNVKYPCLLIIQYQSKFTIGTCPFMAGRNAPGENILGQMAFSHWIHPDMLSAKAENLINTINKTLLDGGDLYMLYQQLHHSVQFFPLHGISKAHVMRLTNDLLRGEKPPEDLFSACTPYQVYKPSDNSLKSKYDSKAREAHYRWSFDTEDLWYSYMCHDITRRVILGRRYRDMDDLVYSIDTKLEDYENQYD